MKTQITVKGSLSPEEVKNAIAEFLDNYLEHSVPRHDYKITVHPDGSATFSYEIKKDKA